ncbi:MAG: hypothetical protein K6B74_12815 [Ruminococcus sp.]|nr:hypothetical protein [Ruminococcus sp.]
MIRKIIEKIGFMLIANSVLFTPIVAHADGAGGGVVGIVVGGAIGGIVVGSTLVSMSKTKITATKAEKYVEGQLELKRKQDQFVTTKTERHKVN